MNNGWIWVILDSRSTNPVDGDTSLAVETHTDWSGGRELMKYGMIRGEGTNRNNNGMIGNDTIGEDDKMGDGGSGETACSRDSDWSGVYDGMVVELLLRTSMMAEGE